MALETLSVTLTGQRPLLMHNGQLANPTNKHAIALKALSGKAKKTEADLVELKQIEWIGGLYRDAAGTVAIDGEMVLACVIEGAKKSKKGRQAQAGVLSAAPFFPLVYDGPSDVLQLFDSGEFCDYRPVRLNGKSRLMRARPRFDHWSVTVELLVESSTINLCEVVEALEIAGQVIGLGDFRPRYGRFVVSDVRYPAGYRKPSKARSKPAEESRA